jgi:hypothetical protein
MLHSAKTLAASFALGRVPRINGLTPLQDFISGNSLAGCGVATHVTANTRAVPLVRKKDAHKGRVFFLPKFEIAWKGITA